MYDLKERYGKAFLILDTKVSIPKHAVLSRFNGLRKFHKTCDLLFSCFDVRHSASITEMLHQMALRSGKRMEIIRKITFAK